MSFGGQTPEALLSRSDSKDPATTCKGITSAGRPCRRALAASLGSRSATSHNMMSNGVVAILNEGDAAAFFCWQHKDQAEMLIAAYSQHTRIVPLKEKSSIDTLMERIGVLEMDDEVGDSGAHPASHTVPHGSHERYLPSEERRYKERIPQEWQNIRGPLMSIPRDVVQMQDYRRPKQRPQPSDARPRPRSDRVRQSNVKASWGCCVRVDEDDMPPPRRRDDTHRRPRTRRDTEIREVRHSSRPRQGERDARRMSSERISRAGLATSSLPIYSQHATLDNAKSGDRHGSQNLSEKERTRSRTSRSGDTYDTNIQDGLPERYHRSTRPTFDPASGDYPPQAQTVTAGYYAAIPDMQQRQPQPTHSSRFGSGLNDPTLTPTGQRLRSNSTTSPPNVQTTALLSLIPSHLSPNTTSALLSELSKPISPADEEGYIYIFWLTPESDASKPDDETAASILDTDEFTPVPSPSRPGPASNRRRRESEVDRRQASNLLTAQALQRFASIKHSPTAPKKILLKIGRANNVHRRLSQWTKQCGQNITLVRYYPYNTRGSGVAVSKTPDSDQKKTVPHVHRVERLVHLELADQRVSDKGKCEQCGREHKEWFEVEATKDGVKAVDEVIRRWVGWAQAR